jgi:protein TonB
VSLSGHGLALLALVYLMQRIALPPPSEPSIALVFAPVPAEADATPTPAAPPVAEPPVVERASPSAALPASNVDESAPAVPQPELKAEAAVPAVPQPEQKVGAAAPPVPQSAPMAHPPPRRVGAARPPVQMTPPAIASLSTPAAASMAPLAPAHPVTGMESDRPPAYPEIARRRGQQGRVVLRVDVSAEGMPVTVTVAESSGYASLDAAALTAVQRWRFVPATRGGAPVPAVADVPVRFRLTD